MAVTDGGFCWSSASEAESSSMASPVCPTAFDNFNGDGLPSEWSNEEWLSNKAYGGQTKHTAVNNQKHAVVVKRSVQSSKTGIDGRLLWTQSTCGDAPPKRSASRRGETSRRSRTQGIEMCLPKDRKDGEGLQWSFADQRGLATLGLGPKGNEAAKGRGAKHKANRHTHTNQSLV